MCFSRVYLFGALISAALCACPGASNDVPYQDACAAKTVSINGRVVDFETCLSKAGCQGVADLRISLYYDTSITSSKTKKDGAFTLAGVPSGGRVYLLVTDASGQDSFLSTLQASPITVEGKDVFGLEIYALQSAGGLYAGIAKEAKIDVKSRGIYVGQVLRVTSGNMRAYAGATVGAIPATAVRFIRENPRFSPGEQVLFGTQQSITGVYGQFVVIGKGKSQDYAIAADAKDYSFSPVLAPLGPGYVAIGVHRAAAKPTTSDAGAP